MYDIIACDKFYIQPYWGTIGSMKWNVLQLQLQLQKIVIFSECTTHTDNFLWYDNFNVL
jgi:hypothetical protein